MTHLMLWRTTHSAKTLCGRTIGWPDGRRPAALPATCLRCVAAQGRVLDLGPVVLEEAWSHA